MDVTSSTPLQFHNVGVRAVALLTAVAAMVGALFTWQLFVNTRFGQTFDNAAFQASYRVKEDLWMLAEPVLDVVSVLFIAVAIVIVMIIALLRKKWMLALQVAVLIAGANITTQVLKKVILDRPDFDVVWGPYNTLPSGHTTVAASVSAALLLVVPRGWRPLTALAGVTYTAATGLSTMVGQWHRPSDVIAAVLVVGAWTAFVCVFSHTNAAEDRDQPINSGAVLSLTLIAIVAIIGLAVAFVVLRDAHTAGEIALNTDANLQKKAFIGSSAAVVGVSATVFGIAQMLRQAVARMR